MRVIFGFRNGHFLGHVPYLFLIWVFFVLGQLDSRDPSSTQIYATGHQIVTLCRAVCEEERETVLKPLLNR